MPKQVMKLFTVAALATSAATAYANTAASAEPVVVRKDKPDGTIELSVVPVSVIKPRVLANYRPACGNTGGKTSRPDDCTSAQIEIAARQAKIDEEDSRKRWARMAVENKKLMATAETLIRSNPSLKARILINGRPACGNTMTKASPPAMCRITQASLK